MIKRVLKIGIFAFIALVVLSAIGNSQLANERTKAAPAPTYTEPAAIQPIATRLGITPQALAHVNIQITDNNAVCGKGDASEALSCFESPDTIYFPKSNFSRPEIDQDATFAHEYLHYIWTTLSPEEKTRVAGLLGQAYQQNKPYFDERLKPYTNNDAIRTNEIHSYAGTEIADSSLPPDLLAYYERYLPNRNALPSYYPANHNFQVQNYKQSITCYTSVIYAPYGGTQYITKCQ